MMCDTRMKTGMCKLDKWHPGRHATAVFVCDSCGKARRGSPYERDYGAELGFCFMCCVVAARNP